MSVSIISEEMMASKHIGNGRSDHRRFSLPEMLFEGTQF